MPPVAEVPVPAKLKPHEFMAGGKKWDCTISLGKAQEVDEGDFSALTDDKLSILDPSKEFFKSLVSRPRICFAIIWALVRDQAAANLGIDPYSSPENEAKAQKVWLLLMKPDVIQEARRALFHALGDFFPERRTGLLTLLGRYEKTLTAIDQEIKAAEVDMDQFMEREISKGMGLFREALQKNDLSLLEKAEKVLDENAGVTSST